MLADNFDITIRVDMVGFVANSRKSIKQNMFIQQTLNVEANAV